MTFIERTRSPIALMRHGYRFWDVMRAEAGCDVVQVRMLHEHLTGIRGEEAARVLYEEPSTERSSALPGALVTPLFGQGPVHLLDGRPHGRRKAMFNELIGSDAISSVTTSLAREWDDQAPGWSGEVDVHDAVARMLFEAACQWVGVPVPDGEQGRRTQDMIAMVDGFGTPVRQPSARRARWATDRWIGDRIDASRRSQVKDMPIDVIARHRDDDGHLLPRRTAAVETINLIRPLVAVSWLVSAMVRAYADHPDVRQDVLADRITPIEMAQEVRRTAPFVPFLATRATADLQWQGITIPRGTLVVLDVWGTNHDPATWSRPDSFDPTRFRATPVTPYNLVPQGGGSRDGGHRCPGEDLTLAVLMILAKRVAALPLGDVEQLDGLRRMPPRPRCKVSLTGYTPSTERETRED